MTKIRVDKPKVVNFVTLDHIATPLQNQNVEKRFSVCQRRQKNRPRGPNFREPKVFKWLILAWTTDRGLIFYTAPYGDPLKNQNFEQWFSAC